MIPTQHLAVFTIALPIVMAVLMIFLKKHSNAQNILNILGSVAVLILSILLVKTVLADGIQVYEVGEWGKYGIMLVADLLSAGMVLLTSVASLLALVYSLGYIEKRSLGNSYHPLFNLMVAGLNGAFLTGDLFNLFVFFELLLLSSCGLVIANETSSVTKPSDKMEATFKYLVLNMLGSFTMLIAILSIYGITGTLNMADIALRISLMVDAGTAPWYLYGAALLFIVVFGNKAALFPLHYWLPDVHPSAPSPISAMLSGVLIKVGVYGMLRVFFLIFPASLGIFSPLIMILALATIVIGGISAMGQSDVKRMLGYSSVGQIGYIFLGLGIGTIPAIAASLVYLVNHAIAKALLFLTSGAIMHHAGTRDMTKMGGMNKTAPFMSAVFLIGAMSISGLPPMGGFIAKFILFDAGLSAEYYIPIGIALVMAVFTLFYLFRGWQTMFWGEAEREYDSHKLPFTMVVPMIVLAVLVLLMGLWAEPLVHYANLTATQLFDNQAYIEAVLSRTVR